MTDFRFGRNVRPNDRPAVCWYHPAVLLLAARDVLSSLNQFRNRDERENFPLPLTVIDRSQRSAELGDFWFDFIADTGDGGNATYAVAHTVLADQVVAEGGQVLPRGELLVLGGVTWLTPVPARWTTVTALPSCSRQPCPTKPATTRPARRWYAASRSPSASVPKTA
ncbi:hypothetical protein [Rhodoferax sp.]|uniref:hypothetical protein n=1 Tax=Rhodoferax sp. TaxID=50421 RepID=UPI00273623D6|nr:hypothetical protein [Rhodoferax sp.]MDP3190705.1 hypothetical protein [Rhodoferax sp.]MDP3335612.1 hypothetical protein [Rhodoferax sp.]